MICDVWKTAADLLHAAVAITELAPDAYFSGEWELNPAYLEKNGWFPSLASPHKQAAQIHFCWFTYRES